MPIKWYGNGDLEDPIYKHFSRIVNFVIHCMIFTAIVSGTWLLKEIKYEIERGLVGSEMCIRDRVARGF